MYVYISIQYIIILLTLWEIAKTILTNSSNCRSNEKNNRGKKWKDFFYFLIFPLKSLNWFEIIICDSRRFLWLVKLLDGHRISFLIIVVGMNLHFLMENIFILQIEISFFCSLFKIWKCFLVFPEHFVPLLLFMQLTLQSICRSDFHIHW